MFKTKISIMKKNFLNAVIITIAVLMAACSNEDEMTPATPQQPGNMKGAKTVLIYMAGRNDLTDAVTPDLNEIKEGSRLLGDEDNLLVFVRSYMGCDVPWLARIRNGQVTDSVSLTDLGIKSSDGLMRASDPMVMKGVMRYVFNRYPAATGHYGLVLWGHGTGWLINNEVKADTRAYGVDTGDHEKFEKGLWINIPTLAEVLRGMPHLKYIMGDCCNLMCLENLYELRDVCDYIIGSPAEIPVQGAPYDRIVPDMFADGQFYTSIIDKYYESVEGTLPLTAVRTSEMEHVAQATRKALQAVRDNIGQSYADMTGAIHYYYTGARVDHQQEFNIFYDAGNFFLNHASKEVYQQWREALEKAVVARRMATWWSTDKIWRFFYSDFTVTEENFHGVSMFVPQNPSKGNYAKYNEDIRRLEWYNAVGV